MAPPPLQLQAHKTKDGEPVSYLGKKYGPHARKVFNETIELSEEKGLNASSEVGGEARGPITFDEFAEICPELVDEQPEKARKYHKHLSEAMHTMQIDTAEAQAMFIAQSYVETGHYSAFTESQTRSSHYEDDPNKIRMDIAGLKKSYTKSDGSVSPVYNRMARHGHSYVGRSPLQVTFQDNYVKSMAILEARARQLRSHVALTGDAAANREWTQINEALAAIGQDAKNASRPEYGFLISAAYAKLPAPLKKGEFDDVSGLDKIHELDMKGDAQNEQKDLQKFVDVGSKFMTGGNFRYGNNAWKNNTNNWRKKFQSKKAIYDKAVKVLTVEK